MSQVLIFSSRFDVRRIQFTPIFLTGLSRQRDNLLAEQRELNKQKPRGKTDESLIAEISRLETEITVAKDDLVSLLSSDSFPGVY